MRILNEIKYNLYQYSCFLVFGGVLGTFNRSLTEVLIICIIFCLSVTAVDFKYTNPRTYSEHFMNSLFEYLYCIVFACIMVYVNADIVQTLFYGAIVIVFVLIRVHTRKENFNRN